MRRRTALNRLLAFFLSIVMFVSPAANYPHQEIDKSDWTTDYAYIFVHGLIGWGDVTLMDRLISYFGTFSGSLMRYLRARGLDCHAATMSLEGSAWDRACELYAQLTGTRTDYGEAHSAQCHHPRYGRDYTGKALIDKFDAAHKVNLIGHSFGGTTILEFLELMANGDPAERESSQPAELSPLFEGGKSDWVYSISTLSVPFCGTTLYEYGNPYTMTPEVFNTHPGKMLLDLSSKLTTKNRPYTDTPVYDMEVDRAIEITSSCETVSSVYYFSVPCSCSQPDGNGRQIPKPEMVALMKPLCRAIGMFHGTTAGGVELDEKWRENDGLVNTVSERAPLGAPQKDIDFDHIEPGIWNVFPTMQADHMFFSGGFLRTTDIRTYYVAYIQRINTL